MTSATLTGFTPTTPTAYARPVQDESATAGLCGAEMPNGKGCLVWPISGGVHYAVVDSPSDFIVNDVVPLVDIGSVVATGSGVTRSSVFVLDGELWSIVVRSSGGRGYIELYKANSPTAPTSWSKFTTIQDVASSGSYFNEPMAAGVPLRLDSGRWVLLQPGWEPGTGAVAQQIGAWTSDNAGVSFTRRLTYNHNYILNYTTAQAMQLAREPNTGYLYFWSGTDAGGPTYSQALWESTDSGSNWAIVNTAPGGWTTQPKLTGYVDDGSTLYAAEPFGAGIYSLAGAANDVTDYTDTGEDWDAPGISLNYHTFKAVITTRGVYYFMVDQVMFTPAGAPAWRFNVHWST